MPKSAASSRALALTSAATVAFLWGLSFLSTKVLLSELPPMRIAFTRFLAASVLLGLSLLKASPGTRLEKRDMGLMALAGFLGTTLYFICENTGLKFTTASNAVLIIAAVPAISIAVQVLVHRTHVPPATIAGVATSIAGVVLVIGPDTLDFSSRRAVGNILILGAALAWVAFNETAKPLFTKYSKLALTTYSTWFGTAFLFPLALTERQPWAWPSTIALLHLGYLAVLCSAAGYFMYLYALDRLGTTVVTSTLNIVPVVGVAGSVVFLNERLGPLQIAGGLVILAGISVVSSSQSKAGTKQHIPSASS